MPSIRILEGSQFTLSASASQADGARFMFPAVFLNLADEFREGRHLDKGLSRHG